MIKRGYSLELLTYDTMKLLENTLNKDKDAEKVPNMKISGVGLVHCNMINDGY